MTNIPDVRKFPSFWIDDGWIKCASRSILKLDIEVYVTSYKLISFFSDENALPDFGLAIAFTN